MGIFPRDRGEHKKKKPTSTNYLSLLFSRPFPGCKFGAPWALPAAAALLGFQTLVEGELPVEIKPPPDSQGTLGWEAGTDGQAT